MCQGGGFHTYRLATLGGFRSRLGFAHNDGAGIPLAASSRAATAVKYARRRPTSCKQQGRHRARVTLAIAFGSLIRHAQAGHLLETAGLPLRVSYTCGSIRLSRYHLRLGPWGFLALLPSHLKGRSYRNLSFGPCLARSARPEVTMSLGWWWGHLTVVGTLNPGSCNTAGRAVRSGGCRRSAAWGGRRGACVSLAFAGLWPETAPAAAPVCRITPPAVRPLVSAVRVRGGQPAGHSPAHCPFSRGVRLAGAFDITLSLGFRLVA